MSSLTQNVLGRLPIVPNGTLHRVPATPRKRKAPVPDRLLGVKQLAEKLQDIKSKVRQRLSLEFDLDNWQGELTLKALERDQVIEAEKMVNEDTVCPELWANLRQGRANLYYISPEMYPPASFICGRIRAFAIVCKLWCHRASIALQQAAQHRQHCSSIAIDAVSRIHCSAVADPPIPVPISAYEDDPNALSVPLKRYSGRSRCL
ncbi:hypothetical protein B0H14DRAFT_2563895 [Mycena olivaceomarginata]|nr:hypothetical protein B0H14DRAFT_2563895 [Mycena olivaceomarginata]